VKALHWILTKEVTAGHYYGPGYECFDCPFSSKIPGEPIIDQDPDKAYCKILKENVFKKAPKCKDQNWADKAIEELIEKYPENEFFKEMRN